MRFEDYEEVQDVLAIMENKRKKETLELLRKLDKEISQELARAFWDAYERIGQSLINALPDK